MLGIDSDHKADLVQEASEGRTSSSAELSSEECQRLINHLQTMVNDQNRNTPENRMRRKVISIVHELRWKTPDGKIDYKRLDAWMLKYSYLHKKLNSYSAAELPALVTQFDNMLKKKLHA